MKQMIFIVFTLLLITACGVLEDDIVQADHSEITGNWALTGQQIMGSQVYYDSVNYIHCFTESTVITYDNKNRYFSRPDTVPYVWDKGRITFKKRTFSVEHSDPTLVLTEDGGIVDFVETYTEYSGAVPPKWW